MSYAPFETPFSGVEGDDLYPVDEELQKKIVTWVERLYLAAKSAKQPYQERWEKYYKMYRSWVEKRPKGDWRSRVWMPVAFYVIETITPRLVAQLPRFNVYPVGPEDVEAAKKMETLLEWAADRSCLYLELVKALKSALLYGTGILKTSYTEKIEYEITTEPIMQVQTADIPTGELDLDGNPITETVQLGAVPTGQTRRVRREYISYQGPAAEAVDIDDFFVDPAADSIETARYVIHRVYRDRAHLEEMFLKGVYKKPPEDVWQSFLSEHAAIRRQSLVGLGPGSVPETDVTLISLLEVWTDNVVVTVAGQDQGGMVLLRAERNPYAHGEKPFIRLVDHLVPHEFWGIGELEPLEGLQDMLNALWNSRIDNVKLVLNTMFMASMDYIMDPADLVSRPGGIIRVREGIPLDQVVKPIELGEVTQSSYKEAAEVERMTEKVSGVSPYQTGQDSPAYNRTATGIALISEQGNTRFSHKVKIAELTGFKRLAKHFASILQQFITDELVLRITGPEGVFRWESITAESIGGRFDFDIEAESSTQTESVRKEQRLSLFSYLAADPYIDPVKVRADLLKAFDVKNTKDYLLPPEILQMMGLYPGNEAIGYMPYDQALAMLGGMPNAQPPQPPADETGAETGAAGPPGT